MKYFISLQILLFLAISFQSSGQFYADPKSHDCLKCHSQQTYSFHNDMMDTEERRLIESIPDNRYCTFTGWQFIKVLIVLIAIRTTI